MAEYIENIKKIFSDSQKIVIVFNEKSEIIWSNQNEKFFLAHSLEYSDFEIKKINRNDEKVTYEAFLNRSDINLRGEFIEFCKEKYTLAILDENNILNFFTDNQVQNYMNYQNAYINMYVTNISAFADGILNNDKNVDKVELKNNIISNCIGITKIIKYNNDIQELLNSDLKKTVENLKEIILYVSDGIINRLNAQNRYKFSTKYECENDDISLDCNRDEMIKLILNIFRYIVFSTRSTKINLKSEITDETVNLKISAKRNSDDIDIDIFDSDFFNGFSMEMFFAKMICEHMNIGISEITNDFDLIINLQFKVSSNLKKFRNANYKEKNKEKFGRFSIFNIMFWELT